MFHSIGLERTEMLELLLQQLSEEFALGAPPQKTKENKYPLILSSGMQIDIQILDPGISFYASLAPLQDTKREELLIYLMRANFLGQGTGEGVISLDNDEKLLTLSLLVPYDVDYKTFKTSLEDFANYVDFWRSELAQFKKNSEG